MNKWIKFENTLINVNHCEEIFKVCRQKTSTQDSYSVVFYYTDDTQLSIDNLFKESAERIFNEITYFINKNELTNSVYEVKYTDYNANALKESGFTSQNTNNNAS